MTEDDLIAAARAAAAQSYSPYSNFPVGAALLFADGSVVTGTNIENASYGLGLCAETVAVSKAMADGVRSGLVKVAVTGPGEEPIFPPCTTAPEKILESGRPRKPFQLSTAISASSLR